MKKYLLSLLLLLPLTVFAIDITVPASINVGDVLVGTANHKYTPVATSTLGISGFTGNLPYGTTIGDTHSNLQFIDAGVPYGLYVPTITANNSYFGMPMFLNSVGVISTTTGTYPKLVLHNANFIDGSLNFDENNLFNFDHGVNITGDTNVTGNQIITQGLMINANADEYPNSALSVGNGSQSLSPTSGETNVVHIQTPISALSGSDVNYLKIDNAVFTNFAVGNNTPNITGLYIAPLSSGAGSGSRTNAWGMKVYKPTLATNNYTAYFDAGVGIGTTTPNVAFQVVGTTTLGQLNADTLRLPDSTDANHGVIYINGIRFAHAYGNGNLFFGDNSGNFTMTGVGNNLGLGVNTLSLNATGTYNTAIGTSALYNNAGGNYNTCIGSACMVNNTTGSRNSGVGGDFVLNKNTTGNNNTASGYQSLANNTIGGNNTASGYQTLLASVNGSYNSALGFGSGNDNIDGSYNTYLGYNSGSSLNPANNETSDTYDLFIGANSGRSVASTTALTNAMTIGKNSLVGSSNTLTIGATTTYAIKVGIGSSTPLSTLSVSGTAGTNPFTIASSTGNTMFTVLQNGNVGINNVTPVSKLQVAGDFASNPNTGIYSQLEVTGATDPSYRLSLGYNTSSNYGVIQALKNASAFTILALNPNGGNVGIGLTSPSQQLEITKNFALPLTVGTTTTYGIIYKGTSPFISDFNYGNNGTVTTVGQNTFVGIGAGNLTMGSTATQTYHSSGNTAIGNGVLNLNTIGYFNSANGYQALNKNTTGAGNTANGYQTLYNNTLGTLNVAMGMQAFYNLTGTAVATSDNIALGYNAGRFQADGATALTTASQSIYLGSGAMGFNNSDVNSIVIGYQAKGIGANSVVLGNDSILTTALKGKVGVGTTSPSSTLFVQGTSTLATTNLFTIASSTGLALLNVDNTGAVTARIKSRVTTITSSATPTFNTDLTDSVNITALATAITSMTTGLSGTPNDFDKLVIRIKDNGATTTIAWGTSYEAGTLPLPTVTVASKTLTVGLIWDSVDSKWACESVGQRY